MGYIRTRGLGKAYKRYGHKWGRFAEWLGMGVHHTSCWILRDISFEVSAGEAVGIIGINGAGKSTLLKLIAGTTQPSTGSVECGGRVSALLELGIGFHPEFTGRQNVWTSAYLAGLDADTIAACMSDIEAFADIGDYIDQPVRTYSSGMQVRLAFAVATAVRPDILVVDEALAVGDVFFQQKCFERIRSFREQGTTLLFVSHSMSTVYALCDRAVLLEGGRIRHDGEPREVIDIYNAYIANRLGPGDLDVAEGGGSGSAAGSYGRGDVTIERVTLLHHDKPAHTVVSDSEVTVCIRISAHVDIQDPHVGFQVRDRRGEALYMTHTHGLGLSIGPVKAGERLEIRYAFRVGLIPGDYSVTAGVAEGGLPEGQLRNSLARQQDGARFSVTRNIRAAFWDGVYNLRPTCDVSRVTGP